MKVDKNRLIELGEICKKSRQNANITIKEVADALQCMPKVIINFEKGRTKGSIELLQFYANIGVNMAEIFNQNTSYTLFDEIGGYMCCNKCGHISHTTNIINYCTNCGYKVTELK